MSPPTTVTGPTTLTESAPNHVARQRFSLSQLAQAGGLVLGTLALIVFFALWPQTAGTFGSVANLRVILLSQSVLLIVAVGALIPILCKQYDFSVGAVCGFSSIVAASILSGGGSMLSAVLAALAFGVLIGAINGLLVTVVGVDSVIVTLGMTTIVTGLATWKTGGQAILSGIPQALTNISNPLVAGVPFCFAIALVVTVLVGYAMRSTTFGRYLHAIGSNPSAARLVGLPTKRLTVSAFVLAATFAAFAGVIQLGISGAGNPRVGPNLTLPAIAAAFLSVAAIKPGRFNVWGVFVAIIFLAVLNSGLTLMGVSSYVNDFANGFALIIGVSLSAVLRRRQR